jgi:hypothetical protein
MSPDRRPGTSPVLPAREPGGPDALPPLPPAGLTPEQIDRWAALIADGRDNFPGDLPSPDRDVLLAAVRQQLRGRLIRLIARAIAARLYRRIRHVKEDQNHA